MTRVVRYSLAFLLVFQALIPVGSVHAGQWVQKEIFWSKGGGIPGSGTVAVHDTAFAPYPLKTSLTPDTTGRFNLKNADVWRDGHAGAATTVDTVVVAYLVIASDSTHAVAGPGNTITSITYELDGRIGGFKRAPTDSLNPVWTQVDSTAITALGTVYNAAGVVLPIRAISGLGGVWGSNGPENALNFAYRVMAFEDLRVRITACTGILSGSLRAFIRYWDDDPVDDL